ncbi:MAG TPA: ribosome recycling factor [Clostridiales bacterium]|jgi:ribosome recycling factor|nr:ribosome recycling factor [Clostridiales bacterium]
MYLKEHKELEERMKKTVEYFKDDVSTIRAGRANPKLVEKIMVDYYGTKTPLNQIANISAPEPRVLVIKPWDANVLEEIEKAIQKSDLGINPGNDGKIIRLVIPQLTEERRKELIKTVKKEVEKAKVALRNERRDAIDTFKKMEKKSEMTEDDLRDAEDKVQEIIDKYSEEIDKIYEKKEKDILEV